MISDGNYVIDSNTKHTLNLKNTIFGDDTLLSMPTGSGMDRATSFDLILFTIPEYWDEGVGNDYVVNPTSLTANGYVSLMGDNTVTSKDYTYSTSASNWYNSTTISGWTTLGVYVEPNILQTIHFDNGNEDINVDITCLLYTSPSPRDS